MSVFAVISLHPNELLKNAVETTYQNAFRKLSDTVWLVADEPNITTQGVCEKLGVDGLRITSVVVTKVEHYWGRAERPVWEWLSARMS